MPEDIREISMSDGLLTARGGQTSHASVVATRLEKNCVVGCLDLQVYETREYARINGHQINFGDPISIDTASADCLSKASTRYGKRSIFCRCKIRFQV